MPCKVERNGQDYVWYCCDCGYGPNFWTLTRICTWCNDHQLCPLGISPTNPPASSPCPDHTLGFTVLITPPESPPSQDPTCSPASKDDPRLPEVPKPVSPDAAWPSDPHPNDYLEIRERSIDDEDYSSKNWSDTLLIEKLRCLDAAIDQHTRNTVAFQLSLASLTSPASTPEHRSCPSGDRSTHRKRNSPSKPTLEHSSRKRHQGNGRKGSTNRREEQESEDESDCKQEVVDAHRQPDILPRYACPFFKDNPHRWRHEKTCNRGYASISRLREHLVREKRSPHELHECIRCLRLFPNEKALVDHGTKGQPCQFREFYYPAEGVGSRIRIGNMIPVSKGGPKAESSQEEDMKWWTQVYRNLFGKDAAVPSCFYEADDIARSNAPEHEDHFDDRLIQTLKRGLPKAQMDMVVRYHYMSVLEAKEQRLENKLGGEDSFTLARKALSQPRDVVKSRRVSSDAGQRAIAALKGSESESPFAENDNEHRGDSGVISNEVAFADICNERSVTSEGQLQHEGIPASRTLDTVHTSQALTTLSNDQITTDVSDSSEDFTAFFSPDFKDPAYTTPQHPLPVNAATAAPDIQDSISMPIIQTSDPDNTTLPARPPSFAAPSFRPENVNEAEPADKPRPNTEPELRGEELRRCTADQIAVALDLEQCPPSDDIDVILALSLGQYPPPDTGDDLPAFNLGEYPPPNCSAVMPTVDTQNHHFIPPDTRTPAGDQAQSLENFTDDLMSGAEFEAWYNANGG